MYALSWKFLVYDFVYVSKAGEQVFANKILNVLRQNKFWKYKGEIKFEWIYKLFTSNIDFKKEECS